MSYSSYKGDEERKPFNLTFDEYVTVEEVNLLVRACLSLPEHTDALASAFVKKKIEEYKGKNSNEH